MVIVKVEEISMLISIVDLVSHLKSNLLSRYLSYFTFHVTSHICHDQLYVIFIIKDTSSYYILINFWNNISDESEKILNTHPIVKFTEILSKQDIT